MAQTYHDLWPALVSWENLVAAYQKCRRRKRYKPDAVAFHAAWESNLLDLSRELRRGDYQPGEYRHFEIFEPKRRTISAAPFRDRVVHHALVRVLEPIFERRFIFDSYAWHDRMTGADAHVDSAAIDCLAASNCRGEDDATYCR